MHSSRNLPLKALNTGVLDQLSGKVAGHVDASVDRPASPPAWRTRQLLTQPDISSANDTIRKNYVDNGLTRCKTPGQTKLSTDSVFRYLFPKVLMLLFLLILVGLA